MQLSRALVLPSLLATPTAAQVFVNDTANIPSGASNNSYTESVDFGDVDLDGDWDAVFADGGDLGNDQNRLWINHGGLQGGVVGKFVDRTAVRFPSVQDDSRDLELVDVDDDADLDIYVSNTSAVTNQGNFWWINEGGEQGGDVGFYGDETATRWIGLDGAGSSLAPSLLLPSGGFIDWSCDCDFGDLDNDGDLDLLHSSYGGAFGGNAPTRIFLNDGGGFFQEFNPSGFQLPISTIANGAPALWAEGIHSSNTTDATGSEADIASSALDVDLGDVDGDLDLDILHGARQEKPRLFANRLEENGGALGFRDVTTAAFPADWSFGNRHYEQEMGDLDGDGDLDIYGLNWGEPGLLGTFQDTLFENDGAGTFTRSLLADSKSDENEGDFVDYDNDGDLDLYVADFSNADRLYRNDENGSGTFSFTYLSTAASGTGATGPGAFTSLDADACDTDADGDYDVISAQDAGLANVYLVNATQTPDVHAPRVERLEALGDRIAAPGALAVRAHVYDNAPYYVTYFNDTTLEVEVDGCALSPASMASSGGQVFRGEVPGNLVGQVVYRARSEDEYQNGGVSPDRTYAASSALPFALPYGSGTPGSLGEPEVSAVSVPFAGTSLYLAARNTAPGALVVFFVSATSLPALDLGDGAVLHVGLPLLVAVAQVADADGCAVLRASVGAGVAPGLSVFAQVFALDGVGGDAWASSAGLELVTQ